MATGVQHKKWSADVKRQLFLDGLTIVALSAELGFHKNSLYRAINHGKYPRVIEAVSRRTGIPLKG